MYDDLVSFFAPVGISKYWVKPSTSVLGQMLYVLHNLHCFYYVLYTNYIFSFGRFSLAHVG